MRVSAVLLFVFLTGGYSLKCYSCNPDSEGVCDAKEKTCSAGESKCGHGTGEICANGCTKMTVKVKGCSSQCEPGTQMNLNGVTVSSVQCCDTDLCNAADGMYKGSFLLLFSPLLFYFMFQ
ncbi:hypothetical protein PO909_007698 [Leuciscus waleckii]